MTPNEDDKSVYIGVPSSKIERRTIFSLSPEKMTALEFSDHIRAGGGFLPSAFMVPTDCEDVARIVLADLPIKTQPAIVTEVHSLWPIHVFRLYFSPEQAAFAVNTSAAQEAMRA